MAGLMQRLLEHEEAYSSETSVKFYRTAWPRIAEGDVHTNVAGSYVRDIISVLAPFVVRFACNL
jgi:hypothetical protein